MLVKIWEGPEATSIWAKITEARKKETKDELEQNNMLLSLGSLLLAAARQYLEPQGNERKIANKLVLLGRKHGKRFLDRPAEPLFGLLGVPSIVRYNHSQSDPFTGKSELRPTDIVT